MNYASFFYTFDEFTSRPTYAEIRRKLRGSRRQHAFSHFSEKYPDDIEYRLGYAESYAENGVYDDDQYQHCFSWIEDALVLPDRKGTRAKLSELLADLKKQQRELHAELGPSPAPELDIYGASFRSGRYDIIENEFTRLQQTVTPCGILGGDEEKQLWRMFQLIIRIAFKKGQPDLAIERLDRYEQTRIGVKLTPIPDFDLQELALGYLAQQSLDLARSRLKHWLSNSRMPIITDTIKQHEAFRDIFD